MMRGAEKMRDEAAEQQGARSRLLHALSPVHSERLQTRIKRQGQALLLCIIKVTMRMGAFAEYNAGSDPNACRQHALRDKNRTSGGGGGEIGRAHV